eukprot:scaffold89447_cov59-Phaeocystis_antarctica.AAC.2
MLLQQQLSFPDGPAQRHGVRVQQLAPGAAPREHVFQPAEEAGEALRVEEHTLALLGVPRGARVCEDGPQEGHHEEEEGQARDREEHATHVQRDLGLPVGPGVEIADHKRLGVVDQVRVRVDNVLVR